MQNGDFQFELLAVAKPKINELRIVEDFRILNQKTINEFAISDMKEVIEEFVKL